MVNNDITTSRKPDKWLIYFCTGVKKMFQLFTLFGDIRGINKSLGFLMISGAIHVTLTRGNECQYCYFIITGVDILITI